MAKDGDLIQLIIYVLIGVVGVIASAYKNRKKMQQTPSNPHLPNVPRNLPADPGQDFGPELGPLMELFDIPRKKPEEVEYGSVENGPSVEEAGMRVDTDEDSAELAGMSFETEGVSAEKEAVSSVEIVEEGQSDIQKMIAKYDAIRKELDQDSIQDDIAAGEIVSVEAEEAVRSKAIKERFFNPRKAIIYSEILKRKEY